MKKGIFLGFFTVLFSYASISYASELKAINFGQKGEVSELEFLFDSNDVKASKFQIKEDKQIIVDLTDVKSTERVMRGFDASEFSGAIVYVKTYKKPKSTNDIRIAVQLRDNVRSALVRKQNRVVLQIENRYGVFSQSKVEENQSYKDKVADIPKSEVGKLSIPKSDNIEDILENITMSGRKKYIGKKITMNLKNIKIEDILKMIAETSGFNLIMTDDVKKIEPVSLNLNDIPWDQAFDTVLDMGKLVARKNGMIMIVQTQESMTKELELLKKAKEASKEQEPMLTKVFPISFASITELKGIITEYSTEKKGKISIDTRTNSLIVKDTAEVIDRMKKIVELLDTQTPQVLIESKIVEVNERHTKSIGLDNGLAWGYDPFTSLSGTSNGGAFSFSTASVGLDGSGTNLFGLSISRFGRLTDLNFKLSMMESESKGKIISSPKVITKNNVAANITQNEDSYYLETTTTGSGTTQTTASSYKSQSASLGLTVTPQVTNDGSISLDVSLAKDSFSASSVSGAPRDLVKRNIKTSVLVDNGSTVVIGGIYTYAHTESHSGIPFLKDIPLVGWLFRSKFNPDTTKKELIIFITPRIINQEEAGLVDRG
jgi:type IV pilus assembly protein PilQ